MKHGDSRKALFLGINKYAQSPLNGCENDAQAMHKVLGRHEKLDPNFDGRLFTSGTHHVTGDFIREQVSKLFEAEDVNVALLYYSGHGAVKEGRGYLVGQDYPAPASLVSMEEIMKLAEGSKIKEVVIILDCCHAGTMGDLAEMEIPITHIRKGMSILAATTKQGGAAELGFHGKFTRLLVRGLEGAAIDMVGHVTVASLYAYADGFFSTWEQFPVFKLYLTNLTALRYCLPVVPKIELRQIVDFFPAPGDTFKLDPSYLHSDEDNVLKMRKLRVLRRLRKHGFVEGINGKTVTREARISGGCRLTEAGMDLHLLVSKGRI